MSAEARGPHVHGEAFRLMTYRADDGSESEVIWNSRDGITPFIVTLRSGKQATHIGPWKSDPYRPDYSPPPGSRMFVDLTPERMRSIQQANVERWWDDPELGPQAQRRFGTVEAMVVVGTMQMSILVRTSTLAPSCGAQVPAPEPVKVTCPRRMACWVVT